MRTQKTIEENQQILDFKSLGLKKNHKIDESLVRLTKKNR